MEFLGNTNAECCSPSGKYELCGCANGVPYIQLTVVGGGTVQTAWLNTETGDTYTTKPSGFVTGSCQEAAVNDGLKFSATAPTAISPFAAAKDGDTTIQTADGSATGAVTGYWRYEAASATWKSIFAVDIVTTISNTIAGHTIATYTNEAGTAVDIKETVTALIPNPTTKTLDYIDETGFVQPVSIKGLETVTLLGTPTWDVATGVLSIPLINEASDTSFGNVYIPVGDKYLTSSTDCRDIVSSSGDVTFTVAPNLSYIPEQDVIMSAGNGNHMHGHVISYDKVTGALVVHIDQKTGSGSFCYWQINLDAIAAAAETITTFVPTITSGTKIGTYTNEAGAAVDVYAPASAVAAAWVDSTSAPTATGNTGGPKFVYHTTTGDRYYVDSTGVAKLLESGALDCGTVYFNGTDPSAATIFDTANPPVTNNNALKNLVCAIYVGTDGSIWTSNGTTYATKVYTYPTHQREVQTATAAQTAFTLTKTPIGGTEKVFVSRNGMDISRAFTWVGAVGTYTPASNYGAVMDAGDILQFHFEAM